jgi:hypothetical protein
MIISQHPGEGGKNPQELGREIKTRTLLFQGSNASQSCVSTRPAETLKCDWRSGRNPATRTKLERFLLSSAGWFSQTFAHSTSALRTITSCVATDSDEAAAEEK